MGMGEYGDGWVWVNMRTEWVSMGEYGDGCG